MSSENKDCSRDENIENCLIVVLYFHRKVRKRSEYFNRNGITQSVTVVYSIQIIRDESASWEAENWFDILILMS
jgi:hypothetical protein